MSGLQLSPEAMGLSNLVWLGHAEVLSVCPFHADHSPSMCVNLDKGLFICYVCGAKGTVTKLALTLGGRLTKVIPQRRRDDDQGWRQLLSSPLALGDKYLASRGVTDNQVRRHRLLATPMGVGVPLHNRRGDVCGLLVRRARPGKWARYVNYGARPEAWPMSTARYVEGNFVVVEGIFGVLNAERKGIPAVATLGASLRSETSWVLNRGQAYVLFDDDQAGYLGAGRVLRLAPSSWVSVPGAEADELTGDDFDAYLNAGPYDRESGWGVTRDLAVLAERYGDRREFYAKLPAPTWGWKRWTK